VPLARTAVSQDPKSSEAQSALGQALFATGDLENASEALAEAVRLDPDGAESLQQLAQLKLALGRPQDALQYAQEAVRKNPDDRHAAVFL
jgi:tetratricopeptide (TPR) repeat protein